MSNLVPIDKSRIQTIPPEKTSINPLCHQNYIMCTNTVITELSNFKETNNKLMENISVNNYHYFKSMMASFCMQEYVKCMTQKLPKS